MGSCPTLDVLILPQTPTMQLVVDRSGSMDDDFGGTSRWDAVRNTLLDPVDGVVTLRQSEIRFGLSTYTTQGDTCPQVQEFAPQLDAADELTAFLAGQQPQGQTPTAASLVQVTATLGDDLWDGDKLIVLATDGEPDLCDLPDPETDEEIAMARDAVVQAVEAAYMVGFRTLVISVGDAIADEHLQDLANAGIGNGPGDPDAPFYVALDQAALVAAFDEIVAGIRECKFDLDEPLEAEFAGSCQLEVNGEIVPYDDPEGWELDDPTTVELLGSSCDAIQSGAVSIDMSCTCEAT